MRIAVLSDIHSNHLALRAVLDDSHKREIDQYWCLGDFVGYGPNPLETIKWLMGEFEDFMGPEHWVMGNHDVMLAELIMQGRTGVDPSFLDRNLNEGFSGGEKKKAEILQMAILEPKYAVLDETDSGLDVSALKIVAEGAGKLAKEMNIGILVITHYHRILEYLTPDKVHVLVGGKIVKSDGPELAEELDQEGYDKYL